MRGGAVLFAVLAMILGGHTAAADQAVGLWLTHKGKAKLKITECGSGLCSQIVWLRRPYGSDGAGVRDAYNPDPSLRSRPVLGLETFSGLQPAGPKRWAGRIYNPEDGRHYDASITVVNPQTIRVKGCRVVGWGCGSRTWKRAGP